MQKNVILCTVDMLCCRPIDPYFENCTCKIVCGVCLYFFHTCSPDVSMHISHEMGMHSFYKLVHIFRNSTFMESAGSTAYRAEPLASSSPCIQGSVFPLFCLCCKLQTSTEVLEGAVKQCTGAIEIRPGQPLSRKWSTIGLRCALPLM